MVHVCVGLLSVVFGCCWLWFCFRLLLVLVGLVAFVCFGLCCFGVGLLCLFAWFRLYCVLVDYGFSA